MVSEDVVWIGLVQACCKRRNVALVSIRDEFLCHLLGQRRLTWASDLLNECSNSR
jgi:hypothetical protein